MVDVNVFVSALISPEGVATRLVRELATVTQRSKFRRYFSIEEAERLITDLWDLGLRVDAAKDIPTVTRDPDDDYLVALLRTSKADVLVTGDRDLLDLEMADVEVRAPREFVERLDAGEVSNQQ